MWLLIVILDLLGSLVFIIIEKLIIMLCMLLIDLFISGFGVFMVNHICSYKYSGRISYSARVNLDSLMRYYYKWDWYPYEWLYR